MPKCPTAPVTAWVSRSKSNVFPKFHLEPSCAGLARAAVWPEEDSTLEIVEHDDMTALGADLSGRPCRMCALERVLDVVLRPTDRRKRRVFTSFTSQGNPEENLASYKFRASSESGQDRLVRVASRLGLPVVRASCGPVTYGFLPVTGAQILQRNLRSYSRPDVKQTPSGDVVECLWALLDDNPPELRRLELADIDPDEICDPWELALLLT